MPIKVNSSHKGNHDGMFVFFETYNSQSDYRISLDLTANLYKSPRVSYSLLVMPLIKSAIKRNKQAQVRRSRNLVVKSAIRTEVKAVQAALGAEDAKLTAESFRKATSEIDRAVKKGTLHPNTAARRKSRLNALIKRTLAEKAQAPTAPKKTATKPAAKDKTIAKKPFSNKSNAKK